MTSTPNPTPAAHRSWVARTVACVRRNYATQRQLHIDLLTR